MGAFDMQGHRGARGLKPENTFPAFEAAFDLGVSSVETDVHLTADGIPVLFHDACVNERLCWLATEGGAPDPGPSPLVSSLTLTQLRGYRADRNPDPRRFPAQDATVTPLARRFAERRGIDPYTLPTLEDLAAFALAYAGELGREAGKTDAQREHVRGRLRLDLELKRLPLYPETIGDTFEGERPGRLEEQVVEVLHRAGLVVRASVRSFDHRSVRVIRQLEPRLTAGVLIAGTAPVAPEDVVRQADAQIYCPDYTFLDEGQVRRLHAAGILVLPWNVNRAEDWGRLVDWGVDGITTDFPDQLANLLRVRGIAF
jgi:glycerophosphoryl diester phosphodiesterase